MTIYVDASALHTGTGTKEAPFKTIQEAACEARPGDTVLVAPGIYREAVDPIHAGTADLRITYRSAQPGQAHITGSEPVKIWVNIEGSIWKAAIPNGIFGDYNPFTTLISGDWFIASMIAHTGDVFPAWQNDPRQKPHHHNVHVYQKSSLYPQSSHHPQILFHPSALL